MIVQNGWTDDLFPAPEALRTYVTFQRTTEGRASSYQFGDLGHSRGSNKANADRGVQRRRAQRFFGVHLSGGPVPTKLRQQQRDGVHPDLPEGRAGGRPVPRRQLGAAAPRRAALRRRQAPQTVRSDGGSLATAKAFDQFNAGDACLTVKRERASGTAVYEQRAERAGHAARPADVKARLRTTGDGGELIGAAVGRRDGRQRLISRGVYRLRDDQKGTAAVPALGQRLPLRRGPHGQARAGRPRRRTSCARATTGSGVRLVATCRSSCRCTSSRTGGEASRGRCWLASLDPTHERGTRPRGRHRARLRDDRRPRRSSRCC